MGLTSKDRLKEIAETSCAAPLGFSLAGTPLTKIEMHIPARRRSKLLAGLPVCSQLVVLLAFLGVLQDFVGLVDFLELLFGILGFVDIRMKLPGKFAIGTLDFFLRRRPGNPQHLVVVSELNRHDSPVPTSLLTDFGYEVGTGKSTRIALIPPASVTPTSDLCSALGEFRINDVVTSATSRRTSHSLVLSLARPADRRLRRSSGAPVGDRLPVAG